MRRSLGDQQPFRLVVAEIDRGVSTLVVRLARAPDVGETLDLPHGAQVVVRHVTTGDHASIAGVILADPSAPASKQ